MNGKIDAGGGLKWGHALLMRPAEGRARLTVRERAAMPSPERMRQQSSRPSDPVDSSRTSRVIGYNASLNLCARMSSGHATAGGLWIVPATKLPQHGCHPLAAPQSKCRFAKTA